MKFMTPSMFFTLINIVSTIGWILILIISRFWKGADKFLSRRYCCDACSCLLLFQFCSYW